MAANLKLDQLKGLIFDLDGTLVDSKLDFDLIREEIGIPSGQPVLEFLEGHPDTGFKCRGLEIVAEHERAGALAAEWIPGAKELLEYLNQEDIPSGILTRNSREITQLTIENLEIPIDDYISRDDCRPKPHPEGLFLLAEKWQLRINELIYIGDFKFDLETARAAGMGFALYSNQKNGEWSQLADIRIDCYYEFLEHLQKNWVSY